MRSTYNHVSALVFLAAAVCVTLFCFETPATSLFGRQSQSQAPSAAAPAFHEEVIAEMTPGSKYEAGFVGDKHLAWVENQGGKRMVRVDAKQQGGTYDDVKYLGFNDDESHFVFFAKRNSSWVLVLDGQEHSSEYSKITSLGFQPAGGSNAFGACNKKKCRLVVDGAETGPEYTDISYPQTSGYS